MEALRAAVLSAPREADRGRVAAEHVFVVQRALVDDAAVPPPRLRDSLEVLTPPAFADVVLERSLASTCGYPCCSNRLDGASAPIREVLDQLKEGTPTEAFSRKWYCSANCHKASKFVANQLSSLVPLSRLTSTVPFAIRLYEEWGAPGAPCAAPATGATHASSSPQAPVADSTPVAPVAVAAVPTSAAAAGSAAGVDDEGDVRPVFVSEAQPSALERSVVARLPPILQGLGITSAKDALVLAERLRESGDVRVKRLEAEKRASALSSAALPPPDAPPTAHAGRSVRFVPEGPAAFRAALRIDGVVVAAPSSDSALAAAPPSGPSASAALSAPHASLGGGSGVAKGSEPLLSAVASVEEPALNISDLRRRKAAQGLALGAERAPASSHGAAASLRLHLQERRDALGAPVDAAARASALRASQFDPTRGRHLHALPIMGGAAPPPGGASAGAAAADAGHHHCALEKKEHDSGDESKGDDDELDGHMFLTSASVVRPKAIGPPVAAPAESGSIAASSRAASPHCSSAAGAEPASPEPPSSAPIATALGAAAATQTQHVPERGSSSAGASEAGGLAAAAHDVDGDDDDEGADAVVAVDFTRSQRGGGANDEEEEDELIDEEDDDDDDGDDPSSNSEDDPDASSGYHFKKPAAAVRDGDPLHNRRTGDRAASPSPLRAPPAANAAEVLPSAAAVSVPAAAAGLQAREPSALPDSVPPHDFEGGAFLSGGEIGFIVQAMATPRPDEQAADGVSDNDEGDDAAAAVGAAGQAGKAISSLPAAAAAAASSQVAAPAAASPRVAAVLPVSASQELLRAFGANDFGILWAAFSGWHCDATASFFRGERQLSSSAGARSDRLAPPGSAATGGLLSAAAEAAPSPATPLAVARIARLEYLVAHVFEALHYLLGGGRSGEPEPAAAAGSSKDTPPPAGTLTTRMSSVFKARVGLGHHASFDFAQASLSAASPPRAAAAAGAAAASDGRPGEESRENVLLSFGRTPAALAHLDALLHSLSLDDAMPEMSAAMWRVATLVFLAAIFDAAVGGAAAAGAAVAPADPSAPAKRTTLVAPPPPEFLRDLAGFRVGEELLRPLDARMPAAAAAASAGKKEAAGKSRAAKSEAKTASVDRAPPTVTVDEFTLLQFFITYGPEAKLPSKGSEATAASSRAYSSASAAPLVASSPPDAGALSGAATAAPPSAAPAARRVFGRSEDVLAVEKQLQAMRKV